MFDGVNLPSLPEIGLESMYILDDPVFHDSVPKQKVVCPILCVERQS